MLVKRGLCKMQMLIPQYQVLVLKLSPIYMVSLNTVVSILQNQCYPGTPSTATLFHTIFYRHTITTCSHCTFSPNLFHGQTTQISIDQMSSPENKKCRPWKVFGINQPQTLRLLSRRGTRDPGMRLSQHYIGPKIKFCNFSNFCRKQFPGLTKGFFPLIEWI